MGVSDIPIFSMLRTRMQWHQERQRVLAENVANADTPGFHARDLKPLDFGDMVAGSAGTTSAVTLALTSDTHIALAGSAGGFETDRKSHYETRPGGNAVSLEDEMLKVADNQMDYQAATALYTRSLGLLKIALGKK